MAKHPRKVKGFDGSLEELAFAVENMTYDETALFISYLAESFMERAVKDKEAGRLKLADQLLDIAEKLKVAEISTKMAWEICKPFMKEQPVGYAEENYPENLRCPIITLKCETCGCEDKDLEKALEHLRQLCKKTEPKFQTGHKVIALFDEFFGHVVLELEIINQSCLGPHRNKVLYEVRVVKVLHADRPATDEKPFIEVTSTITGPQEFISYEELERGASFKIREMDLLTYIERAERLWLNRNRESDANV